MLKLGTSTPTKAQQILYAKGIQVMDVAREADCTKGFVSNVLNGRKSPSPKILKAIETLAGIPAQPLFEPQDNTTVEGEDLIERL